MGPHSLLPQFLGVRVYIRVYIYTPFLQTSKTRMEKRIKANKIKERQHTCLQVKERKEAETCKPGGKEGSGLIFLPVSPSFLLLLPSNSPSSNKWKTVSGSLGEVGPGERSLAPDTCCCVFPKGLRPQLGSRRTSKGRKLQPLGPSPRADIVDAVL